MLEQSIEKYGKNKKISSWSGSLMLLKIFDEQLNDFKIIGGMRSTKMLINSQIIDASSKDSGKWRKILSGAGISSVTISASGIFTDSKGEEIVRKNAMSGHVDYYQMTFGNGQNLTGEFQVNSYERSGNYDDQEIYSFSLESGGDVKFS